MRHANAFLGRVKAMEQEMFRECLDAEDPERIKNEGEYSWLYAPSHHAKTGLITEADLGVLKAGKLLSIGAYPAALERVLIELGVAPSHITVADSLPEILNVNGEMETLCFDCTDDWPETGLFDLILFPESLCIAIGDRIRKSGGVKKSKDKPFPNDALETEVLGKIVKQALTRLTSHGEIRANGPMSHPNVVKAMSAKLHEEGLPHVVDYARYFMTIRKGEPTCRASDS
jgi:hypothetical protein